MNCESCLAQHDGTYGSGRFCSMQCSRSFSTSKNKKERNEKIRQKLTLPPKEKVCPQCSSIFLTKKNSKKFCSRTCSSTNILARPDVLDAIREARLKEIEKGNVGYGIKCSINGIRCDSALEYAFVKWYLSANPGAKIERYKGYLDLGDSKYQPDFLIDGKTIVEVKYTTPYVGERLSKKWQTYLTSQDKKKEALQNSDYEFLWITEKTIGNKFYRDCLKELKISDGSSPS